MQILSPIAWRNLALGLKATLLRFPLPVALAAAQAALGIANIHDLEIFTSEEEYFRIFALLLLGLFAALSADLLAESRGWSRPKGLALSLALVLFVALRVFTLPTATETIIFALLFPLLPAGLLLLGCAPFLTRLKAGDAFWDFNRGLWLSVAFGLLVGVIFAGGLHALYTALEALFEVKIEGEIYGDTWTVGLALIWPLQAMSGIPRGFADPEGDFCPTWARYLISFFFVPFTIAYLLLLYAYSLKILFAWALPEGELGYLVAGYAAFGAASFLLAHPLRENGNIVVRQFCRFFHPALLVPAGLLLLAIAVRVQAYGFTEPRYAVAVFSLWLLGAALAFTLWRHPRPMLLPLSLACLLILGSFGPWGGFGVSTGSQVTRLEQLLARNELLTEEGKAVRADGPIDRMEEAEISSIAIYLNRMGKQPALTQLFGALELDLEARPGADDIVAALGLTFRWSGDYPDTEYYHASSIEQLDVTAFQVYRHLSLFPPNRTEVTVESDIGRYLLQVDSATGRLRFSEEDGPSLDFDLAALRAQLKPDAETEGGMTQKTYGQDQMTLEKREDGLHLRLILEVLAFEQSAEGLKLVSLSAVLLIGRDQP